MILGVDFDNTIVRYDGLFHRIALEHDLIPPEVPRSKTAVRDHMRETGIEDEWTRLQGVVYGPRITEAEPFPGVKQALTRIQAAGVEVHVVSHKTRRPYSDDDYDLHAAARGFLTDHGFHDSSGLDLDPDHVHLETSKEFKIDRIRTLGCTHFVDDLPEFLTDPGFPDDVEAYLFDPAAEHSHIGEVPRIESWDRVPERLGILHEAS